MFSSLQTQVLKTKLDIKQPLKIVSHPFAQYTCEYHVCFITKFNATALCIIRNWVTNMSFPSLSFLPRPLCCRSCGSEEASVRHIRRNSGHHEAAERGGNWYVDHYSYKMNCTVHFDVGTAWWDLSGREREDLTLFYARTLRSIHLFLPLLNGDQFHSYLTAQAQNAVPRIFVFLT